MLTRFISQIHRAWFARLTSILLDADRFRPIASIKQMVCLQVLQRAIRRTQDVTSLNKLLISARFDQVLRECISAQRLSGLLKDSVCATSRIFDRSQMLELPLSALVAVGKLHRAGVRCSFNSAREVKNNLAEPLEGSLNFGRIRLNQHILELMRDACVNSLEYSIRKLVVRLVRDDTLVWVTAETSEIRKAMLAGNWYVDMHPGFYEDVAGIIDSINSDTRTQWAAIQTLLDFIGFSNDAPVVHNQLIFEKIILRLMKSLMAKGNTLAVINLEWLVYIHYVKQVETSSHFLTVFDSMVPYLRCAGLALRAPTIEVPSSGIPKVAFLLHSSSVLAHTQVMLQLFEGMRRLPTEIFVPYVYGLDSGSSKLDTELARFGLKYRRLSKKSDLLGAGSTYGTVAQFLELREELRNEGITALIFVSVVVSMAFAFAMRIAPVQIWWSLKYQGLSFPDIDGYLMCSSFERTRSIGGVDWRVHEAGITNICSGAEAAAEGERIRKKDFGDYELIATIMGREEKMDNEAYLAAISTLLRENPGMGFLWAGHRKLDRVAHWFEAAGVDNRCHYLGWLNDTKPYAHLTDLFLDTFPFGSGHTACEAMYAGKPVLFFKSPETLMSSMLKHIWPVYSGLVGDATVQQDVRRIFTGDSGENLLFVAETVEEYVSMAQQLLGDAELRGRVGRAGKEFVERYLTDPALMARTFCAHLCEIIDETRAKSGVDGQVGLSAPAI